MLYQTVNPHGGDQYGRPVALDFSVNVNPLGIPASVQQAVVDCTGQLDHYPDPYCRELVQAIAVHEKVPASFILCGCGAAELIFSYCAARRPKRAVELAPTFSEYSAALERVDCEILRYDLKAERDFVLDEGLLTMLEREKPDVLFLCNPNNPTGQLIPETLVRDILALCHAKRISLFVDECFLDLTDEGTASTLKPYLAQYPELFILKAFTKNFAMAGLRLGYCLCSNDVLLKTMGCCVQPWNVSIPAQMAGIAALQESEFLEQAREIIRTERPWLTRQLRKLGIEVYPSKANYLLLHSKFPLYEGLLEQGIQIRSCANYHGLSQGWYRIAVKLHEENRVLIDAIRKLSKE